MNGTDVMLRIVELAKVGGAMPLEEAVAAIAAVIDHLDMYSDTYEADVATLMGVGAAIWSLSGPGAGHDPEGVPPALRPRVPAEQGSGVAPTGTRPLRCESE